VASPPSASRALRRLGGGAVRDVAAMVGAAGTLAREAVARGYSSRSSQRHLQQRQRAVVAPLPQSLHEDVPAPGQDMIDRARGIHEGTGYEVEEVDADEERRAMPSPTRLLALEPAAAEQWTESALQPPTPQLVPRSPTCSGCSWHRHDPSRRGVDAARAEAQRRAAAPAPMSANPASDAENAALAPGVDAAAHVTIPTLALDRLENLSGGAVRGATGGSPRTAWAGGPPPAGPSGP
jgi:hypothetical protein